MRKLRRTTLDEQADHPGTSKKKTDDYSQLTVATRVERVLALAKTQVKASSCRTTNLPRNSRLYQKLRDFFPKWSEAESTKMAMV